MTTPFVGRAGELAAQTADLDAAVGGRGGVVLVAGEPGIGKTRLSEELAARAAARGAVVLWGRCWEGAGAPSFWPWVQVVRGYVQVQAGDPASLRHDLGAGAADIAQLVEVEARYTIGSTDGPLESAKIRCPRGHWFNGLIESLTAPESRRNRSIRSVTRDSVGLR